MMEPIYKLIGEVLKPQQKKNKIKRGDYLSVGAIPIIDQGEDFIAGYLNDNSKAYNGPLPVIVFGDHTCRLKYIPFKFAVGADGTQLFRPTDDFDVRFFYYALVNAKPEQFGYQRHFKLLRTSKVAWFPFSIQKKIVKILSAYDDLIENNTRRIVILEEMAQLIYREWFVNYCFPGYKNITMVDSGTEFGGIPEGWKVTTLEEVIDVIESGSRPKGGIDPNETGVPSIGAENVLGLGIYDFSKEKYVSNSFYEHINRGKVNSGDVLLYKDGAKIGRKTLFRDGFPHEICCINEHVFILRSNNEVTQSYLYFWLDQDNITQKIINLNSNAAQPGISQPKVMSLPILVATHQIIVDFENTVEPLLALLFNLAKKNEYLKQIRDLLLPKLISGELDVSDLDIEVA